MIVLNFAATLFAPIILAIVLGVVLSPLADGMDRAGLPIGLSAFLTLLLTLFLIAAILFLLEPVLTEAINRAPVIWTELRGAIEVAQSTLRGLEQAGEEVADALGEAGSTDGLEDTVTVPSITDALFHAPGYAARVLIFVGTLYFFLLSRTDVYAWVERLNIKLSASRTPSCAIFPDHQHH
jgi:predicted PurR-regulated permease PerM